jgi:hypothetical protein
MHETKINTGASEGIPFGEALPGANGGLESVRATLDHKTRLARQYGAVEALIEAGLSPAQIVSLTPEDLERVDHVDSETKDAERIHIFVDDTFGVSVDAEPIHECIEMATKKVASLAMTIRSFAHQRETLSTSRCLICFDDESGLPKPT